MCGCSGKSKRPTPAFEPLFPPSAPSPEPSNTQAEPQPESFVVSASRDAIAGTVTLVMSEEQAANLYGVAQIGAVIQGGGFQRDLVAALVFAGASRSASHHGQGAEPTLDVLGPIAGDITLESRPATTKTLNDHLNDIGSIMDLIAGV